MPFEKSVSEAEPQQFRVVRSDYEYAVEQEEPGGITDAGNQYVGEQVVWTGEAKDVNKINFEDIQFPPGDYDELKGPAEGDKDYVYKLETLVDGEWEYVKDVDATRKS